MPKTFLIVPAFSAWLLCNTALAAEAPNEAYAYITTEMPVSGMNLLPTGLNIPGLAVGGDSFDVTFPLDPMTGIFSLGEATPVMAENPWASFNSDDFSLSLKYVKFGAGTYYVDAQVEDTGSAIVLGGFDVGIAYNIASQEKWEVSYGNGWANDEVTFLGGKVVDWGAYSGEYEEQELGGLRFSLGGGFSIALGRRASVGKIAGTIDHLGETNVAWEATPKDLPTELDLGNLKLSLSFDYWNGMQTETRDAKLLQESDDSFAVSFTEGDTWSSQIRVVDDCELNNQFRIFAMLLTGETIIPAGAQLDIVRNGQTTMFGMDKDTDFILGACIP